MNQKGSRVSKKAVPELRRKRVFPEQLQIRHLRQRAFRLGGEAGFDTRCVVRFGEAISGQRWRRCASAELELVAAELRLLVGYLRVRNRGARRAELSRRSA
jgi:hypothetical protein